MAIIPHDLFLRIMGREAVNSLSEALQSHFAQNPMVVNRYDERFAQPSARGEDRIVFEREGGEVMADTCPQGTPLHRCPTCMSHETLFYNIAMDRGECMACDVSREVDYAEMDGMTMDEGFAALAKIVKEQKHG